MKNRPIFFSRNVINTAKNEEFTRIQKREPVILAGYFFDAIVYDNDFNLYHIIPCRNIYYYSWKNNCECFGRKPSEWINSVLEERDAFKTKQSMRRIWRKQMYCNKDIRLKQVLKYLYSGISLAVLLLFVNKKNQFELYLKKNRFQKESIMLLQKWLFDVFEIESKIDSTKTKLNFSNEVLLKMIDIALKDIVDFTNSYMKNRLTRMREEILNGETKKTSRNEYGHSE